ncbi:hypothetical protein EDB85DRAFT_787299 [Lactarius pseudohatsudake]|nr:hypothetical protein EDB85DRAFT_787299 [Lactarius pseudohatsudake]
MSATLSFTSYPIPHLAGSERRSVSLTRDRTVHTQRFAEHVKCTRPIVVLIPGLTAPVIFPPLLPTSALSHEGHQSTHTHPASTRPTAAYLPDLLPSVDPRSEAAAVYGGVLFISCTFSQRCAARTPGYITRMHTVLDRFFQTRMWRGEKETHTYMSEFLVRVSALFISPIIYLYYSGSHAEQGLRVVPLNYSANDYPIPPYFADVPQNQMGG